MYLLPSLRPLCVLAVKKINIKTDMMKRFLTLLALVATTTLAWAQQPAPCTIPLSDVDQLPLPAVDNKALYEREMARRGPGIAPRFAETLTVEVTPSTAGTWEILPDGRAVWRLRIHSPGARSLNLGFTAYRMPAGGALLLYNPSLTDVQGPFTPADNEEHGQLWTPVFFDDELVVEVQVPAKSVSSLELKLEYVNHDFIGFGQLMELSGSCNLDVICGEADGWGIVDDYRDIIQSVAVIGIGGNTFCTGFLINNAAQDCKPYFMTAFHCGVTSGDAPSLVAYWNYQNSFCRQPNTPQSGQAGNGVLNNFNTGAIWRAAYNVSDFTLVELDDPVSETADAYFAGWSAEAVPPANSICVHHPNTEEKRISFENAPGMLTNGFGNNPSANFSHVRVVDWDTGTTEPGSSGSPLFDQNKRVVGQLHGGGAACGNNDSDWFGSFARSWEGGGTPTSRLRNWLDPDNTGILTLNGRSQQACSFFVESPAPVLPLCAGEDAAFNLNISEAFEQEVTVTFANLPPGVTASFTDNPVPPGGLTMLVVSNTAGLTAGDYSFDILAFAGTDTAETVLTLQVFDTAPDAVQLSAPANAAANLPTTLELAWEDAGPSYEVQVATDIDFTAIVAEELEYDEISYQVGGLNDMTTYFWRVRASNPCGAGPWSEVYSFTTGNITCLPNLVSTNIPLTISTNGTPTVTSSLPVPYPGIVTDVDVVGVAGNHTWVSDLTITLIGPDGTEVVLVDQACGSEDNFNVSFDDEATGTLPCPYNNGGTYPPASLLSAFDGKQAQGSWKLRIQDNVPDDGGTLNAWSLRLCLIPDPYILASTPELAACEGQPMIFEVNVSAGFTTPFTLSSSGLPGGASVVFDPASPAPGEDVTVTVNNLDAGIYDLVLTGTGANGTASETVELEALPTPEAASLVAPADLQTDVDIQPTMLWNAAPNADSYTLDLGLDALFTQLVLTQDLTGTSFTPAAELEHETQYFWRVISINDECGSGVSPVFSFTTEESSGIREIPGATLQLFPNPASREIALSIWPALEQEARWMLFSADGRLVDQGNLPAGVNGMTLGLENRTPGAYLLQVLSGGGVWQGRLAVVR